MSSAFTLSIVPSTVFDVLQWNGDQFGSEYLADPKQHDLIVAFYLKTLYLQIKKNRRGSNRDVNVMRHVFSKNTLNSFSFVKADPTANTTNPPSQDLADTFWELSKRAFITRAHTLKYAILEMPFDSTFRKDFITEEITPNTQSRTMRKVNPSLKRYRFKKQFSAELKQINNHHSSVELEVLQEEKTHLSFIVALMEDMLLSKSGDMNVIMDIREETGMV